MTRRISPTRVGKGLGACLRAALGAIPILLLSCAGESPVVRPETDPTIAPVVRGAEAGLEARLWAVDGRRGVLAAVLGDFGPPPGADPDEVELWRRNGLRVLEIPLDRLESVRDELPTIGPRSREWLGMLPEWVEVARGPSIASDRAIRFDTGYARLGPGRLRLLARCWAVPGGSLGRMRVELLPELRMPRRGHDERLGMLLDSGLAPDGRGLAFDRLLLGWTSDGSGAVLIVPESPDIDWADPLPGRPETEASTAQPYGPTPVRTPTLGELMLTNLASPDTPGDARMVVVLLPRVPERFGLLPR